MKNKIKRALATIAVCFGCLWGGILLTDWLQFHKSAYLQFLWPLPLFWAGTIYHTYLTRKSRRKSNG